MSTEGSTHALTLLGVLCVAALYSSVGHGGASGYLAILSLASVPTARAISSALLLNILVSGIASLVFLRAGHVSARVTWPFILSSVPAAFVGGLLHLSQSTYKVVLAVVLVFAAVRLAVILPERRPERMKPVRYEVALPVGAAIGLVSGMVGVGGGIFLSPLMLLMGWANAQQTAAASAWFIMVNSLAGLTGRAVSGSLDITGMTPLVFFAFAGGLFGARLGARKFSAPTLRRVLAVVLTIAALKLLLVP